MVLSIYVQLGEPGSHVPGYGIFELPCQGKEGGRGER